MKRKAIGTSLVVGGLLAGSFLAGALLFSGGGSGASGSTAQTGALVTPTATATKLPSTPATITPTATATATPAPTGEGNGEEPTGSLTSLGGGSPAGNNGGTQPPAPPAPEPPTPVPPVLPPVEPPAPVPPVVEPEPPVVEPEPEEPEPPLVVNEAPFVVASQPADLVTGIALGTSISVTFSEPMDPVTTEAAFIIEPAVSGTFGWDAESLTMTFDPDAPFDYNTKVEWAVAASATDVAGLAMQEAHEGVFVVLRQKTMNLYSQPARDGHVFSPAVDALKKVVTAGGDLNNSLLVGTWMRGFLSFDLGDLPDGTVDIVAAELSVHQRDHHAQAYTAATGDLWVVSLPYGDLDAGDFTVPTPTICPGFCYPVGKALSTSAANGWKTADVSLLVRADWNASPSDPGLSQFRLQFLNENNGGGPSVWAEFHSGESANMAPVLRVTFTY